MYQDRLVKELRMAKISTIEDANRYLREVYLPKINEKFAKVPAQPQDAHVPLTTPTSVLLQLTKGLGEIIPFGTI